MATVSNAQARAAMAAWTDGAGSMPFGDAGSDHPEERSRYILSQVSCILSMLSAACHDAHALDVRGEISEFQSRNGNLVAAALEGVGTLVDIAIFFGED